MNKLQNQLDTLFSNPNLVEKDDLRVKFEKVFRFLEPKQVLGSCQEVASPVYVAVAAGEPVEVASADH